MNKYKLAVNLGNSNLALGVFKTQLDPVLVCRIKINLDGDNQSKFKAKLQSDLKKIKGEGICQKIIFASVFPKFSQLIVDCLESFFNLKVHQLNHSYFKNFNIDYHPLENMGLDRLANLQAVKFLNNLPAILIDLGTATTIDVHDDKQYLGGYILPGLSMMMLSLSHFTAQLPKGNIQSSVFALGKSTKDCIEIGTYYFYSLAIENLIKKIKTEFFQKKKVGVILTGGWSDLIGGSLHLPTKIIPHLTLTGIHSMVD